MGLDQYINCKGASLPYNVSSKDDNILDNPIESHPYNVSSKDDNILDNPIEIWYGRKEYDLHNWMHKTFIYKGGDVNAQFNSESYVLLDEKDMDDLIEDIRTLDGFEDTDKDLLSEYLNMCYQVKGLVGRGNIVYYTSWW